MFHIADTLSSLRNSTLINARSAHFHTKNNIDLLFLLLSWMDVLQSGGSVCWLYYKSQLHSLTRARIIAFISKVTSLHCNLEGFSLHKLSNWHNMQ